MSQQVFLSGRTMELEQPFRAERTDRRTRFPLGPAHTIHRLDVCLDLGLTLWFVVAQEGDALASPNLSEREDE